jgi:hypothetical protein
MTPISQAIRFGGNIVMSAGAWFHQAWLLPAGLALILFGWFHGKLVPGVAWLENTPASR